MPERHSTHIQAVRVDRFAHPPRGFEQHGKLGFIGKDRLFPRPQACFANPFDLFLHPGRFRFEMFRVIEQVGNIRHVMEGTPEQFRCEAHRDMVDVFANPKLTDQFIVRFEAGGDGFCDPFGQVRFTGEGIHKNTVIEEIAVFILPIDAIEKTEVPRLCTKDSRRVFILDAPPADHLPCGRHAPLSVKVISEHGQHPGIWETAHDCPDLHRGASLGLVVYPAASGESRVIEMRGKVYPAHAAVFLP